MKVFILLSDETEDCVKKVCEAEYTASKYKVYFESSFPDISFKIKEFEIETPGME